MGQQDRFTVMFEAQAGRACYSAGIVRHASIKIAAVFPEWLHWALKKRFSSVVTFRKATIYIYRYADKKIEAFDGKRE